MALTLGAMAIVFSNAGVGPDGKPLLSHMAAVGTNGREPATSLPSLCRGGQ